MTLPDEGGGQSLACPSCGRLVQGRPAARKATPTRQEQFTRAAATSNALRGLMAFAIGLVVVLAGIVVVVQIVGRKETANPQRIVQAVQAATPTTMPARPKLELLERGVLKCEVEVAGASPGVKSRLWIYLPEGQHKPRSLPCVVVAPAGSVLITGMNLSEGDMAEHLPYVHAGFAVIGYAVDGDYNNDKGTIADPALKQAARAFRDSQGGLLNGKAAIDYALQRCPEIDPKRIFAVGHSSAGTIALGLAAADTRIRAVAAFAPACSLRRHFRDQNISDRELDAVLPGTAEFIRDISPANQVELMRCPVFIFHVDDDQVVPIRDNSDYVELLQKAGKTVVFSRDETGGHYDSMLQPGIPQAIGFFAEQGK
jgi:acetyl esterase/lipase